MEKKSFRPKLRGQIHFAGFFVLLGPCLILLLETKSPLDLVGKSIYALSILTLFLISSTYHRFHWGESLRAVMRKIDHSAIFLLIAGTATPIGIYSLNGNSLMTFLSLIWGAALIGIIKTIMTRKVNKAINAAFYVLVGFIPVIFSDSIYTALGIEKIIMILVGGLIYVAGAIVYVRQAPNPIPLYFGHHEIFHFFVLIAASLHFSVIYQVHV